MVFGIVFSMVDCRVFFVCSYLFGERSMMICIFG